MALRVVTIPSVGAVGARPRKEALIDTEGFAAGAAMANQTTLFANPGAFAVGALGLAKAFGRDSSLQGGQGGLPAATHHYWYSWRMKVRTLNANLSTAPNAVVPEELNRLRELSFVTFRFSSAELIVTQADEIPSGTGPQHIGTTHAGVTTFSLPSGVPDRKNAKDVTVSARPVEIHALENFRVIWTVPVGFAPTVDVYISAVLEGLLLRGLT